MIETDILIVGGGPAGATAGKYLSLSGIDNIIVQRKFDFKKPCGGGIRLDAFDEFNIDKNLIQKYITTIALVYKEKRIAVDIKSRPIGIVDRVIFDSYLRDQAALSGSQLYEATFVSLEIFDDYIISKIKKNDEYIEIKSNYLIAADGVNSKIRKLINGDEVRASLTNYVDLTSTSCDICEFHFGQDVADKYYAWAFPHTSGANIGTLAGEDKNYILRLLKNMNIKEESKIQGYKIPHFINNIFYKDRVFFVGDSASQVLPFTYEGIYYAMSSAKILADVLINKELPEVYEKNWNKKYYIKFRTFFKLQNIFLRNDFMVNFMMIIYENRYIQQEMVKLWLGKREINFSFGFFYKVFLLVTRRLLKRFKYFH